MKNIAKHIRRAASMLLALVMLMAGVAVPAYARSDWDMLEIRLTWTDAEGNTQEAMALPVVWSDDQSFWVQVTADAPLAALTININHPDHAYTYDPADGSTLMDVVDAGFAMDVTNTIVINAYDGESLADTFNLYISTMIEMPEEPTPEPTEEPTPEPTEEPTPEPTEEPTPEPTEEPTPEPTEEPTPEPTEEPTPEPTEEPTPEPTEEPTEEPTDEPTAAPVQNARVTVYYRNYQGEDVATAYSDDVADGVYTVTAQPVDLLPGYVLDGEGQVQLVVAGGVADPAEIVFYYVMEEVPTEEPTEAPTEQPTEEPTEAPTEQPTEEPTEAPTEQPTEEPTEAPTEEPTEVPTEIPTEEPTEAPTEEPTEEPTQAPAANGKVTVRYCNYQGVDVATAYSDEVADGTYKVTAQPVDLLPGYVLDGEGTAMLSVSGGVATPAEIVFYYVLEDVPTEEPTAAPTEAPTEEPTEEPTEKPAEETPIPQGSMINRFGTITMKQTALREGPGKDHKVVRRLAKGTAVYMLREELNEKGEHWVRVLVDGEIYFISGDCIKAMTQADSDNWMAEEMPSPVPPFTAGQIDNPGQPTEEPTAEPTEAPTEVPTEEPTEVPTEVPTEEPTEAPTEEPTPAPTEVPAIYTGYALTTTNVAIRSQIAGGDESIVRLANAKELVMVTGQEFHEGKTTWSAITALDGTNGYVPDANLRHINTEEAQYYIDQWNEANATPAPTGVPEQYTGYALTTEATALRTEVSMADSSIIRRMEKSELVMVTGQTYESGEGWSLATTLDNVSGYVTEKSLRRINNEEAQYYLQQWEQAHPTETPTADPVTPEPAKISGYAYTVGDDVYFRHQASSMASIIDVLNKDVVVYVRDQDYPGGEAWHVVQYMGQWGYIRADMLRMMTVQEENAYLDSLATPEPTSNVTPEPYNPDNLSSYGYVSDSSVNFRKEASTSSSRIRQLKQYAFCLVLGTAQVDGVTWYRVNYGGEEGYVHGKYFKQMTIAELEEFLDSDEYFQGIQNNTASGNTEQDFVQGGIVSAEDQTVDKWVNPNSGVQVSYEPFDPFATVAPVNTPEPTETVTIPLQPTATLEPIPTMGAIYPTGGDEENSGGSGVLGWVIAVVVLAALGGGAYAYVTYTNNKRKAAQRAAARRAQAAAQQRQAEARPYARSTQANQPRTGTYPNQAAQRPLSSTAQQARRPYHPQGEYTRPAQADEPQQADYTASYRNPNTAEGARPVGRRSAYRAQQAQRNGYTASYRNEEDGGDNE